MTRTLAIIPARGGSKRITEKNLRTLGDRPLIAHTIAQAEAAESIDQAIVSTDDKKIRDVAKSYGASVPFDRPDELATDDAAGIDVVTHAIDWFESNDETFDTVCVLQVTSPFRTVEDIESALATLSESDARSLVSVTPFAEPPFWAVHEQDGRIEPYFEQNTWNTTRSQEFPTLFRPNGAIFAAPVAELMAEESFYTDDTISYEMPRERSLDIDEPFDLEVARALYQWRNQ